MRIIIHKFKFEKKINKKDVTHKQKLDENMMRP